MTFLSDSQAEYFNLIYILAFFIVASVCVSMSKAAGKRLPWVWLGLFGAAHGLGFGAICLIANCGNNNFSPDLQASLLSISFVCLAEFGRNSIVNILGRGPGRWVLVPLIFLAVLSGFIKPNGAQAAVLYLLGLAGGLPAARALLLASRCSETHSGRRLKTGSIAMALYALLAGLPVLPESFIPLTISGETISSALTIFLQAARIFLILWLAAAVWSYSHELFRQETGDAYHKLRLKYAVLSAAILVIVLCLGWTATGRLEHNARDHLQNEGWNKLTALSDYYLLDDLGEADHAVTVIAGDNQAAAALISGTTGDIEHANQALDRYHKVLEAPVCYLLDINGYVIASSNRNDQDSYVGQNYRFRPYFKQALTGEAGSYFALGVTSGERGYYTSYPVRDGQNNIIGVAVVKRKLESLESAFQQYSLCFLVDPHGIVFMSSQPDMLFMSLWPLNEETKKALEDSLQFGGGPFQAIGLRDSADGRDIIYKGKQYIKVSKMINSDGWSLVLLSPTSGMHEALLPGLSATLFLSVLTIGFFMSKQRSTEGTALISASEENYRSIFNGVNEAIFVHELPGGRVVDVNQKTCEMYGCTRENILNTKLSMFGSDIPPYTTDEGIKYINMAARGEPQIFDWLAKDYYGNIFWVEVNLKRITLGGRERLLAVVRNINERKEAEEALKESENRYRSVFETTGAGTLIIEENETISLVNKEFERISGYSKEDVEGKISWTEFAAGEDLERTKGYHRLRLIDPKLAPRNYEIGIIDRYGNVKDMILTVDIIPGTKKCVVSALDITERKKAEEALRVSEERFYKIFNASPNIMSITTYKEGRFIVANERFLNILGYILEEVIGRTAEDIRIWVKPDRAEIMNRLRENGLINNLECTLRKKSGEMFTSLYSAEIVCFNGERHILSAVNDISERKRLEEEMARLERLNLIGEMAAGIGHEIRNPMTTVRGLLQLLGSKKDNTQYREYYNLMIDELDRANTIITEFLSLAKNRTVKKKMLNLNSIVEVLFPLIQADAMRNDKFIQIGIGDIPDLLLDEKEIRQLVLNLVRNGLEAMPPGGRLTIKTFNEGNNVVLAVQDEGRGIEQDVLEKLGTPFYTTKDSGTGLGLAVCYSIAARHNASIRVETGFTGTTFYIVFTP
ncbi:PAS domain S-box protein [Pelotomaculum propionicicum]|uniref:PAS domain S-box protein n=1 Tax=Pelotomaculum propionicicum TaxID=258475 RepID=UPI003B803A8B